ncbi:MAG: hypothetical protein ACR2N7_10955 [Acidimicrobiia bacterium]
MDINNVIGQLKANVIGQLRLAGVDPEVEAAGEGILEAIEPAIRQAGLALAEQAALEVSSQLPDKTVDVVLSDGQPSMFVRPSEDPVAINTDDLAARITVRLPEELKDDLEKAAQDIGDSVNTYVVRSLSGTTRTSKKVSQTRYKGTIDT